MSINLWNSDLCDILQEYFRGLYDPYPRYPPSFQQPPYPFRPTPMPRGLGSERGDTLFSIYRTLQDRGEDKPQPQPQPQVILIDIQSGASGLGLGWVELVLGCSTILLGQ